MKPCAYAAICVVFALMVWSFYLDARRENALRAACEDVGGYWLVARPESVCLRKGSVLTHVERSK